MTTVSGQFDRTGKIVGLKMRSRADGDSWDPAAARVLAYCSSSCGSHTSPPDCFATRSSLVELLQITDPG